MLRVNRKFIEELLRHHLDAGLEGPPRNEEDIARLLRVRFDEIDLKAELTSVFENEEVVNYLLTLLDEERIRLLLFNILTHPDTSPVLVMKTYCPGISVEALGTIEKMLGGK